ncbi:uncharacterized protein GGS22DRAFT_162799 [Annulohypoxylon maeteangense]|uniref:uncharacterized protein n=1 Tax=Annulohypoxylon maeteangense TaxID=1927788 RepID=UPI0020086A55|nr:uncharacterized protein GGS22DRAFT_162799 [Annulohypoxylon maeteangense]KAI0885112.1 hypothetical protein GGS22DRAFT_162799 [Annulohypoxylon maeteangense]
MYATGEERNLDSFDEFYGWIPDDEPSNHRRSTTPGTRCNGCGCHQRDNNNSSALNKEPETRATNEEKSPNKTKGISIRVLVGGPNNVQVSVQRATARNNDVSAQARRGHGTSRNAASQKKQNSEPIAARSPERFVGDMANTSTWDPFDGRELLFSDDFGSLKVSRLANLDTQLKIGSGSTDDLIMSTHCARELGVLSKMSTNFEDPCLRSISGHSTAVNGILRKVQFRLRGSSVTFCRNFWVCDAIDGIVDVMIGASFIKENFKMLFEKQNASLFGVWHTIKKETEEQKREREEKEREQKKKVEELEKKRREREEKQRREDERRSNSRK